MNSAPPELSPDRWARVEQLFDAVADMPVSERAAYLRKACGDDGELRAYIEALARSDVAKNTVIEDAIHDVLDLASPDAGSLTDIVGERIGPYRIVSIIGSGGMGVVYLAERADEHFRQQVAIKVVRQRLIDPEIEARLVGERQILANLQHPNIARLFDGGTTADGTPYLVMEYIDGLPIDEYCDGRRLTVNERLELFRKICSAVHYAHQNLVVHRDIKPTNILVTADGTPKLLDFGIAKLLDAGGAATDGLTRVGAVMMTPENATPEQVQNGPITTATDIYALGLLLYRLLTGQPAYRVGNSPSAMAQAICEHVPERPSTAVRRHSVEAAPGEMKPELIWRYRGTTREKLSRLLKGDLDNIVLLALRKEPQRRYRSAHELSEDLRLHLASLPVLAQPDTWSYRTGKFIRRHVAGVAMSVALVGLLVAFGVAMTVQNQRIAEERDTARQVSTFLEEIFMTPDPGNARGLDISAKEILAKGAERISGLDSQPAVQATLMETIGRVYFNLGEYEPSIDMLEASLRIRSNELGEHHPLIAATKNQLALPLIRTADYKRAGILLQEALERNRSLYGDSSTEVAASFYNLAELHQATGNLEEAARLARESIDIYAAQGELHAAELAEGKSALARILVVNNELDQAETLYREALALVRTHLGHDHPLNAYYLQNLAVVLNSKGDIVTAEAMFRDAIAAARNILGDDHDLVGSSLVMLGTLLHNKGEHAAAERALREALAVHTNARGPDHPFVAYDMTSLAMLLQDEGLLEEAESLLKGALRIYEASVGPDHQYVASTLTELGVVLTDRNLPQDAEPLLLRALEIRRRDFPDTHPLLAATNLAYSHALARLGRYDEAERLLLDNVPTLAGSATAPDRRARRAMQWAVSLYEDWEKPEEADLYRHRIQVQKVEPFD
ncbi:MAG TPA: serine/threonine-protein kinase [Woeseiaceae bacterium]|nr:serine/threonine-protein kinase [Woeseiaceae bacterium]